LQPSALSATEQQSATGEIASRVGRAAARLGDESGRLPVWRDQTNTLAGIAASLTSTALPTGWTVVTTVRRLVAFYVDEHNRVLPYSAFRGQTPDEMYFGTGDAVPADLMSRAAARAGHALKPTDRRRTRPARQSTRPRDHGVLTAVPTTRTRGPVLLELTPSRTALVDAQHSVRGQDGCP
jgi:hypothetical protein